MSDFFTTSVSTTRWLTEEVFKLIEFVESDEAIYNPRHKYYFCRPYVENFWRDIDQKLDKNPGASLAKWTNLRISFRREFTNYLEEQVPPCWSYFDRMFFLHPYLRKKQQPTSKNGDTTLQDTLVQISELSHRRAAKELKKPESSTANAEESANGTRYGTAHSTQSANEPSMVPLANSDPYFDYYDEAEPNNSELDDMIDDEQQHEASTRYPQVILETPSGTYNKIKSECEDEVQDKDLDHLPEMQRDVDTESVENGDELLIRNTVSSLAATSTTSPMSSCLGKRSQHQLRMEHLNRLQTRSYHEDLRAKRSRSQERSLSSNMPSASMAISTSINTNPHGQKNFCVNPATHSLSNVSFVRPTLSKAVEALSMLATHNANNSSNDGIGATSMTSTTQQQQSITQQQLSRHYSTSSNPTTTPLNAVSNSGSSSNTQTTRQVLSPSSAAAPTPHMELCDCKTDPDAFFLMSLLPDIQKLNGRDRGKVKIAFQNILQDYLYPD